MSGTTTTYTYDGDGNRVLASTGSQASKKTQYVWDPTPALPTLARELDGNGASVRDYAYGADVVSMVSGGKTYYFQHDGLGSVMNLTSSTGATEWTYDYLPYGGARTTTKNDTKAPANVLGFTGQVLDSTGLYYLRARQCDPATGRFTAVDPIRNPTTNPYVAAYVYGSGNPVTYADPSGRITIGVCLTLSLSFFGIGFGGSGCVVASSSLQVGLTATGGTGGSVGVVPAGASAGLVAQVSSGDYVQDLGGPFYEVGASAGAGGGVQGSVFGGLGYRKQPLAGATFGVQLSTPSAGHRAWQPGRSSDPPLARNHHAPEAARFRPLFKAPSPADR